MDATVNVNFGVEGDLHAIHDIMCNDENGTPPLITLFMERWLGVAQKKELQPEYPVSSYSKRAHDWLHGVFLL